ncbi:MAG: T9SS type A sorting domain-containing protein [Candidatus Cloacimonetes bacterium]|nr:T9SS type A sorting domain-containing protein [Candidatus Cloacimonadota bacterium]
MKKQLFIFILILCYSALIYAEWSSDPGVNNAICDLNGEQAIPKVVTSSVGDTYIGWFSNDSGNYDVRLQRLDQLGNELWEQDGIIVSDNPAMSWLTDWDMTVDDNNHAILTFQDIRNAGNNNIYAYRVSPDGTSVWGEDGLELSNSGAFDVSPKVCVTSTGNIVVTWQADYVIIMQKIAPDGTLLWGDNGITMSCADTYSWPQPIAVEDDNILLKFFHDTGPSYAPTRHCYMQKYDSDGIAVWDEDIVVSNAGGISAWTQVFNIISDEDNGCFITWHDSRGGGTISYPFVQHVNSDGSVVFTANGIQLSAEADRQNFYPESVYNAVNEELITYWFQTNGNQNNYGITGQKLDANGDLQWGANGNNLINISPLYVQLIAVRAASDDLIIFYEEYTDATNAYVKAIKLDTDGNYSWPDEQITMCSVASSKVHSVASQFSNNQIIASWEDDRNGPKDIYAQNINFDGTLGVIEYGFIEGNVILNGGIGVVTDVEVEAGGVIVNPDTNGNFSISIPAGTYDLEVSLEYYTTVNLDNIVVTSGSVITVTDITLNWILVFNLPQNVVVDPYTGAVSWDPPEPYPGTELQGYNIYLDSVFLAFLIQPNYLLTGLINGIIYTVGISAVYDLGESEIGEAQFIYIGTGAGNDIITNTVLISNYPNPFNPITNIAYSITEIGKVTIEVYNLKGQLVKTLVNEVKETGEYSINWNGTDKTNKPVSSGVYLYKMKSGNYTSSKKMILMK